MSSTGDNSDAATHTNEDTNMNMDPGLAEEEEQTNSTLPSTDTNNPTASKPPQPSQGRKPKSWVWPHFTVLPFDIPINRRATCNYCKRSLACPVSSGTSCLSNHLNVCKRYPPNINKTKQATLTFTPESSVDTSSLIPWKFDQDKCRKYLALMIMVDELPFRFVEHQGFRNFCRVLQPLFVVPSRTTIGRDVYNCYKGEKLKLKGYVKKLSSRVCLTTDSWTSNQNLCYMCLTLHFIDDEWKLNKRIINFCPISGHSGEVIGKSVEKCLLEWGIEKVLTITVDNATANDVGVGYLKKRLLSWKGSILGGEYLHMRCAAHILNLIVKDGLYEVDSSVLKIRSVVKFVRSSPARFQKFKTCALQEKLDINKLLCLDVETRWNSTYLMLESALKFEKAFELLISSDTKYASDLRGKDGIPSDRDWEYVRNLLPFLEMFYNTTLKLSGSMYVTGNEYMKEIYGLGMMLSAMCENEELSLRVMANKMKKKYDKYWGDVNNLNIMMFIAVVLDPRHKMEYVEWTIESSYLPMDAISLKEKVRVVLSTMYDFYCESKTSSSVSEASEASQDCSKIIVIDKVKDASSFMKSMFKKQKVNARVDVKSELERYLSEDLEADDPKFDILAWWKVNSTKYQVLSMMAKDVLAIPVSTVASESAFSAGGRVLDYFRSSLTPRFVEALICGQDWLKHPTTACNVMEQASLEQEIAKIESSCITDDHPIILIDE